VVTKKTLKKVLYLFVETGYNIVSRGGSMYRKAKKGEKMERNEVYTVVFDDGVNNEVEFNADRFIDVLLDLNRYCDAYDKEEDEICVTLRIYEGEDSVPSNLMGKIVYDENGGTWRFISEEE